jgi:CRP-like cAMP-binding protein
MAPLEQTSRNLFEGLDEQQISTVLSAATRRRLPAGKVLFRQGDPPSALFCLEKGRIRVATLGHDGAQTVLREMGPGDLIGCAAVFRLVPYPATAVAVSESTAMAWAAEDFLRLMRQFPQLGENALAIVGERTLQMLDRVRLANTGTAEQRVAAALLQALGDSREKSKERIVHLSRQELAEFSGVTLFSVSRFIAKWTRERIVEGGRRRIAILDEQKLRSLRMAKAQQRD